MKIKVECNLGKEKREIEIERPRWAKNQIVSFQIEDKKEFFLVEAIGKEKIILRRIEIIEPEKTIPFISP